MKFRVGLFLLIAGWWFFKVGVVEAAEFRQGESVEVEADEVVNGDLFAGGETVRIEGVVNGDVFVGGGMVEISGVVNGDLWVGGGSVEITGTVRDDVMVGGGNVSVRGARIGDDLNVGAGNFSLDKEASVGGSLVFGTGSLVSQGRIGKGMVGGGGSVVVEGQVGQGVTVGAGKLALGRGAMIAGDVNYTADKPLSQSVDASVSGEVKQFFPETWKKKSDLEEGKRTVKGMWLGFQVWSFLSALLVGGLLVWLVPGWLTGVSVVLREKPLPTLGWGALVSVLVLPVFLVLLLTVIGIPLAFILLILFFLELYLAKLPVGMALGNWVAERAGWSKVGLMRRLIVGLVIYYVLVMLPVVGGLVWVAGTLAGVGAMKLWKFNRWKQMKK